MCPWQHQLSVLLKMLLPKGRTPKLPATLTSECYLGQRFSVGVREGTSWDANFSVDTKNNTSNGARGAKMIFPSGRGAGFKMN